MSNLSVKIGELSSFIRDNLTGEVYFDDYQDRLDDIQTFINVKITVEGMSRQKSWLVSNATAMFKQDIKVTFFVYNLKKTSELEIFKLIDNINKLLNKFSLYPSGITMDGDSIYTPNTIVDNSLGEKFNNYVIESFFIYEYEDQIS